MKTILRILAFIILASEIELLTFGVIAIKIVSMIYLIISLKRGDLI